MNVIVKDYNGHVRIEQADLDALNDLESLRSKIANKNREIEELRRAIDNLISANSKIGNELNATRWDLKKANERIADLQKISVEYEIVSEVES
jgi:septal ring factor EnvC (AmiA/AmiB activator)